MTLSPKLERELRMSARSPGTYPMRFWEALGAKPLWGSNVMSTQAGLLLPAAHKACGWWSGRVLKAYAERKGASAAKALLSPEGLRDSIAAFLRYAVESATEKGSARGCLLMCVAPLVNDAEVQRFLQNAAAGGAALVEGRFRDGITAGEIPSDFPVAVRAIQVTYFARGLTMRALIGTPRKTLLRDAEEAADLVLLPRLCRQR